MGPDRANREEGCGIGGVETVVYVDVLLVLNYLINAALVLCMCKLAGRAPKRRRIVAAALVGSAGSLTIFLPFLGFWLNIGVKLALSAVIVLLACRFRNLRTFAYELFLFFAVSFFFAGVMLGIWMFFAPRGMFYYNGVVYFDLSSVTLIVATVAAYLLLSLGNRLARAGRLQQTMYRTTIAYGGRSVELTGLLDTGNTLYEPFSGAPVMVCCLDELETLLPGELVRMMRGGQLLDGSSCGVSLRLIPYESVGRRGAIPAFRPDRVEFARGGERWCAERIYVGISLERVGDHRYSAILNPDIVKSAAV